MLDGAATPPANPVLTIGVLVVGAFRTFRYTLTRPVDANIVINRVFADNYVTCGGSAQGSMQRNTNFTINAGQQEGNFAPDIVVGIVNTMKNTVYNTIIDGSAVINGGTITVGSFTVDIVLVQCT